MHQTSALRRGFTLIELLIVVAIIAILAAIAVPNFLEAQVRAKVARVKSDMRTVATALESYRVDANVYPPTPFTNPNVLTVVPTRLSTPISYITTANFLDPFIDVNFRDFEGLNANGDRHTYSGFASEPEGYDPIAGKRFYYQLLTDNRRGAGPRVNLFGRAAKWGAWEMSSLGPNKERDFVQPEAAPFYMEPYDPTNGTISVGEIIRTQALSEGRLTLNGL
jgi:prepilin-type N-terminal cleavage/methylation domain-containing protein